ncbi:FOG: Transposon-encoded proteins with TYA, reverse transcriptase, integrase domains in various combinations [Plasmopara halstedii]|uniref:FOG: Transposon-encoded proteins with TYA, reverse transcriptase, integrase domains in various combinations n=1 Tax=Plasmopara halstedii TaxID=4781 RepID=A0A0P1B1U1_PLAHL|nr:FOG: Transposon-encoded proteins with TYA, reverse transcriptase, integrase domains in various combinations [Plasmopara halstedii]CEG48197.1 FOG: Transposon-encoded proteins with TYA, reverse transcriptase, integrase domains in various combinations [Plasmopara halstedii]|eukprot:XP_024584566.1 FOG: Transposon-encoded proteins with TYA, reverse transcriptase, integrase domains in various combinations [Plasmopara halstedii]
MDQPGGLEDTRHPDKKCLLRKELYGTKQAAREWNNRLNAHLQELGLKRTAADLAYRRYQAQAQERVQHQRARTLKFWIGIEIRRDLVKKTIYMDQRAYIKRLAENFGIDKCKEVHTPANESEKLIKLGDNDVFVPKCGECEVMLRLCVMRKLLKVMGEGS